MSVDTTLDTTLDTALMLVATSSYHQKPTKRAYSCVCSALTWQGSQVQVLYHPPLILQDLTAGMLGGFPFLTPPFDTTLGL